MLSRLSNPRKLMKYLKLILAWLVIVAMLVEAPMVLHAAMGEVAFVDQYQENESKQLKTIQTQEFGYISDIAEEAYIPPIEVPDADKEYPPDFEDEIYKNEYPQDCPYSGDTTGCYEEETVTEPECDYADDNYGYPVEPEEPNYEDVNDNIAAIDDGPQGHEVRFYIDPGQYFQTRFADENTNRIGDNMPPTPTRDGYRFLRWSLTPGGVAFTGNTVVSGLTSVYAQWGHEVAFHGNPVMLFQGSNPNTAVHFLPRVVPTGQSVSQTVGITWPAAPQRNQFIFIGWYDTSAETGGTRFTGDTPITVSVDLHARWQMNPIHTITFNPYPGVFNPANAVPIRQVVEGQGIRPSFDFPGFLNRLEPGNPDSPEVLNGRDNPFVMLAGTNVEGWWTGPHGTGTRMLNYTSPGTLTSMEGANVRNDVELFPFYVFRVTFDPNFPNSGVPNVHRPTRDVPFVLGSGTINNNERLSRLIPEQPYNGHSNAIATRPGYTFVGWYTVSGATGGERFTGDTLVTTSRTVWARWEPEPPVTITFRGNNGSWGGSVTTQTRTVPTGGSISATTGVSMPLLPARDGYFFMGWYPNSNATGTRFIYNTTVYENIDVYARWVPIVTITFDQNGSQFENSAFRPSHSISFPAEYSLMDAARAWDLSRGERAAFIPISFPLYTWQDGAYDVSQHIGVTTGGTGGHFNGIFNSQPDGRGFVLDNNTVITADMDGIKVYAMRARIVTFHTNHESVLDGNIARLSITRIVPHGQSIVDNNLQNLQTNITVLVPPATWRSSHQTGSTPNSQAWLTNWNLTGWSFMGWNTEPNGRGQWFANNDDVSANKDIFAIWSPGIVFDPGMAPSGLIMDGLVQRYVILPGDRERVFEHTGDLTGTSVATDVYGRPWPNNPVWPDHVFVGWNTALNRAGTTYGAGSRFTASRRLYAQWNTRLNFYATEGRMPGRDYGDIWQTDFLAVGQPIGAGAIPASPIRNNWSFAGWNSIRNVTPGQGTDYTASTIITMSRTIYAQWSGIVTFDLSGGNIAGDSTNPTRVLRAGQSVNQSGGMPENPSRGADTFIGWFILNYETMAFTPFNPNTPMVNGHFTVYARFIAQYDVLVAPNLNFGTVVVGYGQLPTQQFNIINMGTAPIVITLSHGETGGGSNPNWQLVNPGTVFDQGVVLQPGDSIPAIVRPITGLQPGTHETVFHVSAASVASPAVSRAVDTITATLTVVPLTIVEVRNSATGQPMTAATLTMNSVAVTGTTGEFILPNATVANVGEIVEATATGFSTYYFELDASQIGTRIIVYLTPENRNLTINNLPDLTLPLAQTQTGLRQVNEQVTLEHGTASGYKFLGWIRGGSLPPIGANLAQWADDNNVTVRDAGWYFNMPAYATTYTAVWGNHGIVGGSAYQIAFHIYTGNQGLISRFGSYGTLNADGILVINVPVTPGMPHSEWSNQNLLNVALSVGLVHGVGGTPGHAFWGWFRNETLNNSGRRGPTANAEIPNPTNPGLRRPLLTDRCEWMSDGGMDGGSQNRIFDLLQNPSITQAQIDNLFGNTGTLDLFAIWSLWGDVNDDDVVNFTDLGVLQAHLLFRYVDPNIIDLNRRAGDVFNNASLDWTDFNLLQSYLLTRDANPGQVILGILPPELRSVAFASFNARAAFEPMSIVAFADVDVTPLSGSSITWQSPNVVIPAGRTYVDIYFTLDRPAGVARPMGIAGTSIQLLYPQGALNPSNPWDQSFTFAEPIANLCECCFSTFDFNGQIGTQRPFITGGTVVFGGGVTQLGDYAGELVIRASLMIPTGSPLNNPEIGYVDITVQRGSFSSGTEIFPMEYSTVRIIREGSIAPTFDEDESNEETEYSSGIEHSEYSESPNESDTQLSGVVSSQTDIVTTPRDEPAQTEPSTDIVLDPEVAEEQFRAGFMVGDDRGNFRPNSSITRAEAAAILVRTMDYFGIAPRTVSVDAISNFTDINPNAWYAEYIAVAYTHELLHGFPGGTFNPNQPISREEFATMLARTGLVSSVSNLNASDASHVSDWATDYVYTAFASGLMHGDAIGTFRPREDITRAEAAATFARALDRGKTSAESIANVNVRIFPDASDTSAWHYFYVVGATNSHWFVNGDDVDIWTRVK